MHTHVRSRHKSFCPEAPAAVGRVGDAAEGSSPPGPPRAPNMKEDDVIREEDANEREVTDKPAKDTVSLFRAISERTRLFFSLEQI